MAIFDLDGFKAYNDTFGHPAGDALLAGLGRNLAAVVGEGKDAHIGSAATSSSSRPAPTTASNCSWPRDPRSPSGPRVLGRVLDRRDAPAPGSTLEEALHDADQRLYANKRSSRDEVATGAKDALLQVLAEQNAELWWHISGTSRISRPGLPRASDSRPRRSG